MTDATLTAEQLLTLLGDDLQSALDTVVDLQKLLRQRPLGAGRLSRARLLHLYLYKATKLLGQLQELEAAP
jgi:hypothetical protein